MNKVAIALMLVLASFGMAQDGSTDADTATATGETATIADILMERPELSAFATLMEETGLLEEVADPGVFTLFAPTDEAFDRLGADALEEFLGREGAIEALLRNHIALGGSSSSALAAMGTLTNIAGEVYFITEANGGLEVNGAMIATPDLEASNGVVHVIDTVLVP